MVREIALTRGLVALVDGEDFEWLSQWKWCANNQGYAVRCIRRHPLPQRMIFMHREIMPAPDGYFTDHANRDRLDNRRANLRVASYSENVINRPYRNRTGFRGVSWDKGAYRAAIKIPKGERAILGRFATAEDAARAYDVAARQHHGRFAVLNFPEAA